MYNESLKRKFIALHADNVSKNNIATTLFNDLAPYEEVWGADFCTKSTEDLMPVLQEILGVRRGHNQNQVSLLKSYVRWCIASNVPGACDGMLRVDVVFSDRIVHEMVSGPAHLQRYLDDVFDPEASETTDITCRCFFWMAFSGISEQRALHVSTSNVDLDAMCICMSSSEEYPLYKESLLTFRLATMLDGLRVKRPGVAQDKPPKMQKRVAGDQLLRGVKAEASLSTTKVRISKKLTEAIKLGRTTDRLKYSKVRLSGEFFRAYEAEKEGLAPSFREYILSEHAPSVNTEQLRLEREYLAEYTQWKNAFYGE